jgi:hypothetical protein
MNIKELRQTLNKLRLLYREARELLGYCNRQKIPTRWALIICRNCRNQLLNTMLKLKIALAVRAARRGTK